MSTRSINLPDNWPTIADVYYDRSGPLGPEIDFASDKDGTTFFVADVEVITIPKGSSLETLNAVKDAIRSTVDRIGRYAIRPFPQETSNP